MMASFMEFFRRYKLHVWAMIIAVALWLQVHGQGEGSASFEIPLQVEGLPADMVIVNDLPDHVRVTVKGLQSRLKDLRQKALTMPLDVSDITTPGVVARSLQLTALSVPAGVRIEKVQPDRIELQVDRVITRSMPLHAHFELPEGWKVRLVSIVPIEVELAGPEVWLDSLSKVETTPIRPELKNGLFRVKTGVESPSGKAIRLVDSKIEIEVKGELLQIEAPVIPNDLTGGKK